MYSFISSLITGIADQFDNLGNIQQTFPYFTAFAVAMLVLGILGRMTLGKRSAPNHAVSSAMAILFIYILTIAIYTFKPWNLQQYLTPLPFVTLAEDVLVLFPFQGVSFHLICTQILPLLILAFLVNLLDDFIPQGNSIAAWFLLRFVTVALAMGLHLTTNWAFNTFLPDVLVQYAPAAVIGVLILLLSLGILKALLGLVLTVVNPILGGIYAFFFSSMIGREITKAVFTTVLLCVLFFCLEQLGFAALNISESSLITYLPMTCLTMVIWYLLGHTL